ncbi:MAG: hypothetical protein ACFFCZ_22365 [Promethearchaeota archaeon]
MEIENSTEYGVSTLEYYQNHSDFVVEEKRLYYYIFKNDGQIPVFQRESELHYLPPEFATYIGRIRKEKILSTAERQDRYRARQRAFWEPSQEVQAWLEDIELTPAEVLEKIFTASDWNRAPGSDETIQEILLYEILDLRQCEECNAWKSPAGQSPCILCEIHFCNCHLSSIYACPTCTEQLLEDYLHFIGKTIEEFKEEWWYDDAEWYQNNDGTYTFKDSITIDREKIWITLNITVTNKNIIQAISLAS